MSDHDDLARIEQAARELIPALTERLTAHGLGELEVRHGELRVRVAATGATAAAPARSPAVSASASPVSQPLGPGTLAAASASSNSRRHPVASPAVGFFVYADGLGPGLDVEKGDALGWVEMLGVRHDVRAPRSGTVRGLPAESGEAVEYGQPLVEMEERPS